MQLEDITKIIPELAEPIEQPAQITKEVMEELVHSASSDPFENFELLAKITRKRVRENWDAVYGNTGEEGSGKTTLGIQFGKRVDDNWSLKRNVVFSPEKNIVRDMILKLPKYAMVDVDEAIKIMYKLQWYSDISIFLNIIYALCRRENKISLLNMPRFKDFNEYFRNWRVKLWIHVIERGVAVVFMKHWSPFIDDPWLMKDNQKRIDVITKNKKTLAMSVDEQLRILRKSPNFLMEIAFPPLTNAEEKEFEQLRIESGVYDDEYTTTRWEKIWRDRFSKLVEFEIKNKRLKYEEISEITEFDSGSLRNLISDMRQKAERNAPKEIQETVDKVLNIKPTEN